MYARLDVRKYVFMPNLWAGFHLSKLVYCACQQTKPNDWIKSFTPLKSQPLIREIIDLNLIIIILYGTSKSFTKPFPKFIKRWKVPQSSLKIRTYGNNE